MRQLPVEAALVRALNDGRTPFGNAENLIADLWSLWAGKDHPVRAEMKAKAINDAKLARVVELRSVFERRKRAYGLG